MDLDRGGHTSALPQRVLRTLGRVNTAAVVQRHPALRWLAPLAVVGVVSVVATGVFRAQASSSESLPDTTPKSLIEAVQRPHAAGFSGTVVSHLSLGLPELPSLGGDEGDGSSMTSLLTGSHTLKVWYGGPTQQRIALLGATDETDLFRSGRQLWQWSSADRTALHAVLPKDHVDTRGGLPVAPSASPSALQPSRTLTPADLAGSLLRDLDPSTKVTVGSDHRVANRDAYQLVLTPRTADTTIGSVRVAVDGDTKLPLGVQVFARGAGTPAVDVAYTSINFAKPAETSFVFNPPDDATVRRYSIDGAHARSSREAAGAQRPAERVTTTGSGWSTVWTYRTGKRIAAVDRGPLAEASSRVYGPWGAGRLFTSDLANVLVVDDGRVLAGAVEPNALYAAAK